MRIRPCIDIHNGRVKQIVGSTLQDGSREAAENYVSAEGAAWYADLYRRMGLPGGHTILLNPVGDTAMYEADRQQAFRALEAYPGGMQAGGGITPSSAGEFLDHGASHVIVTSYVFRDGKLDQEHLLEMVHAVGREHLVLDLSCRRQGGEYRVVTDRWQKVTTFAVNAENLSWLSGFCDEFLVHAADVEGRQQGIDTDLVQLLGEWQQHSGFPVTYAGGVHALEDLDVIRVRSGGRMDVTVGSALRLFGGSLDLADLVQRAAESAALGIRKAVQ